MKEELGRYREKARRSFEAARRLAEAGDLDFAISRLYYGLFYLAQAALMTKNARTSKHSAVISAFYHQFVATGEFDKSHHQLSHRLFDERMEGDYAPVSDVTSKQFDFYFQAAAEFERAVGQYLDSWTE